MAARLRGTGFAVTLIVMSMVATSCGLTSTTTIMTEKTPSTAAPVPTTNGSTTMDVSSTTQPTSTSMITKASTATTTSAQTTTAATASTGTTSLLTGASVSPVSDDIATEGSVAPSSETPEKTTQRRPTTTTASNSDPLPVIIGAAMVVVVVIVLITAICLCCMMSRKQKDPLPPSSNGGFEPSEVRSGKHTNNDYTGTTIHNINEHTAKLSESDTLPSSDPLKTRDPDQTYSRAIHRDDRGSRSSHGSNGSSRTNSMQGTSNGMPSRDRPGSNNIFDRIDPTKEVPDELELSPTVSPSSGYESENEAAIRDPAPEQPMPTSRKHFSNPTGDITKRPTPQPRPRTVVPSVEDVDEPSNSDSPTVSPRPPTDKRPFKKGKGPDGSDQAALLANVIRRTPRPISRVDPDNDSETKYW